MDDRLTRAAAPPGPLRPAPKLTVTTMRPPQAGYYRRMSDELFVPEDFAVPGGLVAGEFRLAPLGPQHNDADYAAWMGSIDHIRATPGFPDGNWPHEMSLNDNLRDLERHAQDFAARRGFTYTVLSAGTGDVIGCVYIYPARGHEPGGGAERRQHAGQVRGAYSIEPNGQSRSTHARTASWRTGSSAGSTLLSNPGYAPTAPRSTRSSTTRSSRGWNATGHSVRSSTLRGPDQRAALQL
jgi:hypothetical protein